MSMKKRSDLLQWGEEKSVNIYSLVASSAAAGVARLSICRLNDAPNHVINIEYEDEEEFTHGGVDIQNQSSVSF